MSSLAIVTLTIITLICGVSGFYSEECKKVEMSSDKIVRYIENADCTLAKETKRIHEHLNHLHMILRQGFEYWKNNFINNPPYVQDQASSEAFNNHDAPINNPPYFQDQVLNEVFHNQESSTENYQNFQHEQPNEIFKNQDTSTEKSPHSQNQKETKETVPLEDKYVNPVIKPTLLENDDESLVIPIIEDELNPVSRPSIPGYEGLDHPIDIRMSQYFRRLRRETSNDDSQSKSQGKNN